MERSRIKMIRNRIKLSLPVFLGALGGYLYYIFIGCNGSCAITGGPVNSTLYGSLIGLVLTDWKKIISMFKNIFRDDQKLTEKEN